MAKVVVTKLAGSTAREIGAKGAAVAKKRVRNSEGQIRTVMTLDVDSKTFGNDFTYVFGRNVAKARRENKRVTGVADRAPDKP
jgi:hypothetical protein